MNNLIPGLQEKVDASDDLTLLLSPVSTNYVVDPPLVVDHLIKLQTGASDARSDDTGKLKLAIAEWLNKRKSKKGPDGDGNDSETDGNNSHAPSLSLRGKEERGISNDITGRLICPIEYDWDDPEYVHKLIMPSKTCF